VRVCLSLYVCLSVCDFPRFTFPLDHTVFFDPLAGFLHIEACIEHCIQRAQDAGAVVRIHERALEWTPSDAEVTLTTDQSQYTAARLVLTLGPWAAKALAELDAGLTLTRKVQLWYAGDGGPTAGPSPFPCFASEMDYGFFYGFPPLDEHGVKAAEHTGHDEVADPDQTPRDLMPGDETNVKRYLNEIFPAFKPKLSHFSVCLYTMTPDEHFIIDRHPHHSNVFIAAGFSGHGFKFACVVGEALADLATQGHTSLPIDFLKLDRLLPNKGR